MKPASTKVAPGPNWLRVIASLFQKMLLNRAAGLEKSGAPAGRVAWNSGSFASEPRPAECPQVVDGGVGVMHEFSDDAVVTLLATELLTIRTFAASSRVIAPPRSAAPLSTIMLLRMLTGWVNASARKIPPPSSPEKLPSIRLRSMFTAPEPLPRQVVIVASGLVQSAPTGSSVWIAIPAPESTASL